MDPITAISLLLGSLSKLAEFGTAISTARAEGRDLTPAEVAIAGASAQAHLDALKEQIKAAGG